MQRKGDGNSITWSESEEAAWYATSAGHRQTEREFDRALRTGTLSRSPGIKVPKSDPKLLAKLMRDAKHR
jgi:sugar lactone lactonase YvrE